MTRLFTTHGWAFIFLALSSGFSGKIHANTRSIVVEHQCQTLDPLDSIFYICTAFRSFISTPLLPNSEHQTDLSAYGSDRYIIDTDSQSIEFFLHKDATWSDGSPVVAEDYILTIKRILNNPNAQSTARQFSEDIIGSENCEDLNAPDCAYGAEMLSPYNFKLSVRNLTDKNFFWKYSFEDLLPTPSAFWREHGDSTFNHPDLPTYGAYKLAPSDLAWTEALKTEIKLLPDPLSKRKQHQHFPSVTAIERQTWNANLIRENVIEKSIPDVILNISGISEKQQKYLNNNERKSVPPISMRGALSALLDRSSLKPELRDAVTLLLESEEFSSRHSQYIIEPTDRLMKGMVSDFKFNSRFTYKNRNERLKVIDHLLASLDISPTNRKTLNLIYDYPRLRVTAELVKQLLQSHGLDVDIHFFNSFDSTEFSDFRKNNDIHIELLSWVSSMPINSSYLIEMLRISVLNLLSEDDYDIFQELENKLYTDISERETNNTIAEIDNLLVNKGGFAVLGQLNFVSLLATDLCLREGIFTSSNYTLNLLPCDSL